MAGVKTVGHIVNEKLCVRCGGCVAACPISGAIRLNNSFYPVISKKTCTECGICVKVCPGHEINIPELYNFIFERSPMNEERGIGPILDVYVGHSKNSEIRKKGSSGGIVTQLLIYLLETGKVDAVTTVSNNEDPLNPKALLTSSLEKVRKSTGSKYTIVPVNERLKHINRFKGTFAFVGLPCHIQSLRKWCLFHSEIREKIGITISLFCNHNLEKDSSHYLLNRSKINLKEVTGLSYRHNSWPGGIAVKIKNREWKPLHENTIKEAYNYLSKVFICDSCRYCLDFCGELADISIGDPWLRGDNGEYLFQDSRSLILAKTENGKKVLLAAEKDNQISLEKISKKTFKVNFMPAIKAKRNHAIYNINKLQGEGKLYPNYYLTNFELDLYERIKSCFYSISFFFYRSRLFRITYLSFAFSKYGERWSKLKNRYKKWKFTSNSKRHGKRF